MSAIPERMGGRPGWPMVLSLATGQLVSWGILYYGFSLFLVPMERELGWSRVTLNGALTCGLLVSGLAAYPVGAWIDRKGGRLVMSLGTLIGGAALALWAMMDHIALFYLAWAMIGVAMAATLYEPAFAVLTGLFRQDYRHRILVLTLVGGFASTIFMPATQGLIDTLGWRPTLWCLAAILLGVVGPIHLLLPGEPAEGQAGLTPPRPAAAAVRAALRTPIFWGLVVCFVAYYATFSAISFHFIPLLAERGFATAEIMIAVATIGPAQVAGRLVLMAVGRRIAPITLGRLSVLLFPLSVLVLLLASTSGLAGILLFAGLYGCGNGIMTVLRGTAVPDLLGPENYGAVSGSLAMPSTLAKALSPFAAAGLWSLGGGYQPVLYGLLAGGVLTVAGYWFAARGR